MHNRNQQGLSTTSSEIIPEGATIRDVSLVIFWLGLLLDLNFEKFLAHDPWDCTIVATILVSPFGCIAVGTTLVSPLLRRPAQPGLNCTGIFGSSQIDLVSTF